MWLSDQDLFSEVGCQDQDLFSDVGCQDQDIFSAVKGEVQY